MLWPVCVKERCFKCNLVGHFARDCPEEHERCYNCNKLGHIAKDCTADQDPGRMHYNDNRESYKCVCITISLPGTRSNRDHAAKQHAIVSIQLNIVVTCPTYPEKFTQYNIVAPFLQLLDVITPQPPGVACGLCRE